MNDYVVIPFAYVSAFVTGFICAHIHTNRKLEKKDATISVLYDRIQALEKMLDKCYDKPKKTIKVLRNQVLNLETLLNTIQWDTDSDTTDDMPGLEHCC